MKTFSAKIQYIQSAISTINVKHPRIAFASIAIAIIACCGIAIKLITDRIELYNVRKSINKSIGSLYNMTEVPNKDLHSDNYVKLSKKEFNRLNNICIKHSNTSFLPNTTEGFKGNRFIFKPEGIRDYSKSYILDKKILQSNKYTGFEKLIYISKNNPVFYFIKGFKEKYTIPQIKDDILVDREEFDNLMLEEAKKIYENPNIYIINKNAVHNLGREIAKANKIHEDKVKQDSKKSKNIKGKELLNEKPYIPLSFTRLFQCDVNKLYIAYEKGSLDECLSKIHNSLDF